MTILGRTPGQALRVGITLTVLVLWGCSYVQAKFCSRFGDSDIVAMDAPQRASLLAMPAARPAKGDILLVGGGYSAAANSGQSSVASEFYSVAQHRFLTTGPLLTSRVGVAPFALGIGASAGQVLVAGGASGKATAHKQNDIAVSGTDLATIEAFNPKTGAFTRFATPLPEARSFYTATVLRDGTVLIAGGLTQQREPLDWAQLYDPVRRSFTIIYMNHSRVMHTATLLPDGTVLIAGGLDDEFGDVAGSAEIYDPRLHTFFDTKGDMPKGVTLAGQTATLIAGCNCAADGKVLLAGGFSGAAEFGTATESSVNTMLLYDPKTQTFAKTAEPMTDYRFGHSATLLPGGKVLLAGGVEGQASLGGPKEFGIYGIYLDSAEIFDAATGKTTCIGGIVTVDKSKTCRSTMVEARLLHAAVTLPSGQVLLAGGVGDPKRTNNAANPLTSSEYYSTRTGKFTAGPALAMPHVGAGVVVVP